MLSTEIPPPDLPCSPQISHLKSSSVDERAFDDNQHQLEVDPFKSGLDDSSPLPKFSIRGYVFSTRGKDIRTNWPFSQKNLQLCLKHGVKDVLPPFQSLDSVRNQTCTVENTIDADVRISGSSDHLLSAYSTNLGEQVAVNFENTNSSGSHSDINSIPPIKSHLESPEAVNLPGSFGEKPESLSPVSNKIERSIQNPVKSCKLVVKLSKTAAPGLNEHLAVNSSVVLETMASKVCPVCKKFSSSSNTTLNAHIDQCLSGVSTMELASNSKVGKHRIKPRKIRLMEDIYATALHCTLEDLDRRNGTKWASNLGFPDQELEVCADDEQVDTTGYAKCSNEESAVYVDSSGTKFLSLSKFSDLPSKRNGARKLVKKNKQSKVSSSKNSKTIVKKHKLLKYPHDAQICSSSRPSHCPEDNNCQQRKLCSRDGHKEEDMTAPVKAFDKMKFDEPGMEKKAVGTKTGVIMINREHEKHTRGKILKNLRVKGGSLSSHGDSFIKYSSDSKSPAFSDENPLHLPFERHKTKENSPYNPHDDSCKQPSVRKSVELTSLDSRNRDGKRNFPALSKFNMNQSRKHGPSIHEHHIDPHNDTENYELSHRNKSRNKRMEIDASPDLKAYCTFSDSILYHHFLPGGQKFSSLRKKLSVTCASVPELKEKSRRRHLNFKKRRLRYLSESDEEAVVPQSAMGRQDSQVEKVVHMGKPYGQPFTKKTRILKLGKEKAGFVNSGNEVSVASKGSETASESSGTYSHGVRKHNDSCMGGDVYESTSNALDALKDIETGDDFVCEPNTERTDGEAFIKAYSEHYQAKLLLRSESDMFCADKVVESLVTPETHAVAGLDTDEGHGNYYVEVDPIPIPGPPGSFLPSPGRMSSEELQGNSSLTTCRLQSSEDKHELVDMESLNSPISSASMASESAVARSDSLSVVNLSEHSHGAQHTNLRNISEDRTNPDVECSHPFEQAGHAEAKLQLDESMGDFNIPALSSHRFENSLPCCCSRKEGTFQIDSLNYHESQLLRRRTIASLTLPAQEKHMRGGLNEKDYDINSRPETLPEKEPASKHEKTIKCAPVLVSHNLETKFPTCGDCEFPSPSTPNPVLRLMGKNLMVMNKDEDLSPQTKSALSIVNDHGSLLNAYNGDSTVRFPNEHRFSHHTLSQAPPLKHTVLSQPIEINSSHGFESIGTSRIQGLPSHPASVMFSRQNFDGSFTSSLERYGMDTPRTYDIEKVQITRAAHGEAIFSNQTWGYPLCNGSRMAQTANFQVPASKGIDANSVKWNCSAKGSNALHPNNSLIASAPSTDPMRSSLYFSPGFS